MNIVSLLNSVVAPLTTANQNFIKHVGQNKGTILKTAAIVAGVALAAIALYNLVSYEKQQELYDMQKNLLVAARSKEPISMSSFAHLFGYPPDEMKCPGNALAFDLKIKLSDTTEPDVLNKIQKLYNNATFYGRNLLHRFGYTVNNDLKTFSAVICAFGGNNAYNAPWIGPA